tara:strand:- start:201 stop:347 length:147 start_codon:yes stop_codon:yes gene_type:complete
MKNRHKGEMAQMDNLYDLIVELQKNVKELQNQHIILLRELASIKNRLD